MKKKPDFTVINTSSNTGFSSFLIRGKYSFLMTNDIPVFNGWVERFYFRYITEYLERASCSVVSSGTML
jgi:hypothetical protein